MAVEAVLIKGGNLRRMCEVTLADGKEVTVEPYAIYTAPTKRRHYLWFQVSDLADDSGWRNPEARTVTAAKLTESSFNTRREYDPFDRDKFPVVHYAVPTHDGRQRWMDSRSGHDKQALTNR